MGTCADKQTNKQSHCYFVALKPASGRHTAVAWGAPFFALHSPARPPARALSLVEESVLAGQVSHITVPLSCLPSLSLVCRFFLLRTHNSFNRFFSRLESFFFYAGHVATILRRVALSAQYTADSVCPIFQ